MGVTSGLTVNMPEQFALFVLSGRKTSQDTEVATGGGLEHLCNADVEVQKLRLIGGKEAMTTESEICKQKSILEESQKGTKQWEL